MDTSVNKPNVTVLAGALMILIAWLASALGLPDMPLTVQAALQAILTAAISWPLVYFVQNRVPEVKATPTEMAKLVEAIQEPAAAPVAKVKAKRARLQLKGLSK